MFAWVLDAILKFAPAYRKLGGDAVDAPMRVYAAWRVARDSLPDPEPMIIHCGSPLELMITFCYPGDRPGNIRRIPLLWR